jgi:thioredoxin reductase (NADPH)
MLTVNRHGQILNLNMALETRPISLQNSTLTGAAPNTAWLDAHLLETSLPGVFAVGDARGGSIKRVASAVGEGSTAISLVHKVLQE